MMTTARRRWGYSLVVRAVVVLLVGATLVAWWAIDRGYVFPPTGYSCTDEGIFPVPSFETLVEEHGKSPYCARQHRGETWF